MNCYLDELSIKLSNVEGCNIVSVIDIFGDYRYLGFEYNSKKYGAFFKKKDLAWRFFPYTLINTDEDIIFIEGEEEKNRAAFRSMMSEKALSIKRNLSSYDVVSEIKKY